MSYSDRTLTLVTASPPETWEDLMVLFGGNPPPIETLRLEVQRRKSTKTLKFNSAERYVALVTSGKGLKRLFKIDY